MFGANVVFWTKYGLHSENASRDRGIIATVILIMCMVLMPVIRMGATRLGKKEIYMLGCLLPAILCFIAAVSFHATSSIMPTIAKRTAARSTLPVAQAA